MNSAAIPPLRAVRLIIGMKLVKLRHQVRAMLGPGAKMENEFRTATARAKSPSAAKSIFILFVALFFSFGMSFVSLRGLEKNLKSRAEATARPMPGPARPMVLPPARTEPFLNIVVLVSFVLVVGNIVFAIGNQNRGIGQLDAEIEWLLSLPVSSSAIYLAKVGESLILNVGWITLSPLYASVLWMWGYRWSAVPIALLLTLALNFMGAVVHFSLEILLRRFFSALMLNTIQALALLFSMFPVLLAQFFTIFIEFFPWSFEAGQRLGKIARFLPTALCLDLLQNRGMASSVFAFVHPIEVAVMAVAAWGLVDWSSRLGLEAVHSGRRRSIERRRPALKFFPGVAGKDFLLFGRDKLLWAQILTPFISLVFPALIPGVVSSMTANPLRWGAVSLGIGVFSLVSSATTVIVREGDALWLLYLAPKSLLELVIEKTWVCIGFSWVLSLTVFFGGIGYRGRFLAGDLFSLVWIVFGIPLYGILGASLGVLGADPLAAEKSRRLRADLMGLAVLFGGLLIGGMFLPGVWAKVVHSILFLMLTLGWMEKARTHIEYLLDPTALPPPRLHPADGMTTVLTLLLLQLILIGGLSVVLAPFLSQVQATALAFLLGYPVAVGLTALIVVDYFRNERLDLRKLVVFWRSDPEEARTSVVVAFQAGAMAVVVAVAGWYFLSPRGGLPAFQANASIATLVVGILGTAIAVIVRPALEEVLFRGLVFQSFRQSFGFLPAAVSAAFISAAWLPKTIALPAFLVGLTAAWAFEKSRSMFAPMAVQVLYSLVTVGLQILAAFSARP